MVLGTFRPSATSSLASRVKPEVVDDDDDIVEIPPPSADCIGWAYVGSHNFTPSAWGTLSGSGFTPVLNVRISSVRPRGKINDVRILGDEL